MEVATAPRMRTIPQAHEELIKMDPETAITLRAIRRMVSSKQLPAFKVGNKTLINFDLLLQKLSCYNDDVVCVSQKGDAEHG